MLRQTVRHEWIRYAGSIVIVTCFVTVLRVVPNVNGGAAAPLLLLAVLLVARSWGTGPALLASVTASGLLSYYFLPPIGFAIDDPTDWVLFITFTVTAILVGELAGNAEMRRLEAQQGHQEIERLYQELRAAFGRASEAEAARRNEQLKAALLDALTHNLRTPLTAIKAAVTALIGAVGWHVDAVLSREGQAELLQVIDQESDRLNRFIEALSAAGTKDGSQPANLPIDLEPIVRAGLARAQTLTREHQIEVALEDTLPLVAVDAAAVAEVVYILFDNASKYAPSGTSIRLSAEREDKTHVRVAVSDEGPGIAPEYRERVFENFFRIPAREPRDPRRGGAGLGLSIGRRLVEAQSGRMWIETPISGRGTTVAFTLPVAAHVPADERPGAAVASN